MKFFKENNLDEYKDLLEVYYTTDVNTNLQENLVDGKNTVELVPGGSKIRVTDKNKLDFIKKKCYYIGY